MTGRRLKRKRSRYSLGYYWPIGKYGKYPLNREHRNRSRYQQIYSFVLFIVFNHCVYELGSHEKVLHRKEDVAREKTQFFQKNVFWGKTRKKTVFFQVIQNFRFFGTLLLSTIWSAASVVLYFCGAPKISLDYFVYC